MAIPPHNRDNMDAWYQQVPTTTSSSDDTYTYDLPSSYDYGADNGDPAFDHMMNVDTQTTQGLYSEGLVMAHTSPPSNYTTTVATTSTSTSPRFIANTQVGSNNNTVQRVGGYNNTRTHEHYSYNIDPNTAYGPQNPPYTAPGTHTNSSLQILLPFDNIHGSTRQSTNLWDQDILAPRFLIATHEGQQGASLPAVNSDESTMPARRSNAPLRPTTEYTFVPQQPDRDAPAGQLTMIRKTAMKNFLLTHGRDIRSKRSKRLNTNGTNLSQRTAKRSAASKALTRRPTQSPKNKSPSAPVVPTVAKQKEEEIEGATRPTDSTTVVLSSGPLSELTPPDTQNGIVWHGAPNVLYSPFFTTDVMTVYLAKPFKEVQLSSNSLNGKANQFREWPEFPLENLEVERLKYYCVCRFGSPGLARYWVPVLIQSKDAFYSTICISAAHDEVMEKEFGIASATPQASARRLQVRDCIIKMINESMQQYDISDGTIIAVLHVWLSELIGGDGKHIRVHQEGLYSLIKNRGGLDALGVEGQLAQILVIITYLASCMLETMPDKMYMQHATGISTEPPQSDDGFLDSPIFRATPFCSTSQARWTDSTLRILELTRQATSAFFTLHDLRDSRNSKRPDTAQDDMTYCHNALLAFPSIRGTMTKEQGLGEVVRLSCCIFVRALVLLMPLSQAAQDPALQTTMRACGSSSAKETTSLLLQLKEALKSSPFEDCWDTRSTVLLWCGLVALASANGLSLEDRDMRKARDFIAAVTLRTAVLHVFNRPVPMLGMLRRFVMIQRVLGRDYRLAKRRRVSKGSISGGAESSYQLRILDSS